jgi:tyrosyl-tRNA synthetase
VVLLLLEHKQQLEGKDINSAKVVLADEATRMLHGESCLEEIRATAKQMFDAAASTSGGSSGSNASLPRTRCVCVLLLVSISHITHS